MQPNEDSKEIEKQHLLQPREETRLLRQKAPSGELSKMSHTAVSECVSKQLARLNIERQESHFLR